MEFDDDLFGGDPMEHLVKILQNASPQAIQNAMEQLFCDYAILEIAIEEGLSKDSGIDSTHKDKIKITKQDLAIKLMSDILSQE